MPAARAPATLPLLLQLMCVPEKLIQPLLHSSVPLGASRGTLRVAGRLMVATDLE
ncbi:hypothetical protein D3C81_1293980 [compost metagenome]